MIEAEEISVISGTSLSELQLGRMRAVSPRIRVFQPGRSWESLAPHLADAQVFICHWNQSGFDLALAPRLRWVQLETASVEVLFGQPIMKSDVVITNTSGIHAVPIAEYVIASILAFARRFTQLRDLQIRAHWPQSREEYSALLGAELRGSTLGVLGYGSIGREIGRLGKCFGQRLLALKRDPSRRSDEGWQQAGAGDPDGSLPDEYYGPGQILEFVSHCDYLAVASPLTRETQGLISESTLRAMKPTAYLVNVARGGIIDEQSLVRALREGWIAGAGLDVTSVEPLPAASALYGLNNVILTPHVSGFTNMYNERATDLYCENLRRYIAHQPLLNVVSRESGY